MNKGIQLALLTAIISGLSVFFAKIFVSKMDPVVFTTLKNIFVAMVLSLIISRSNFKEQLRRLKTGDWVKLILIGAIGGGVPFALFFTGLTMTSAATGAIIHKTLFIWVAFLAVIFLKEKLRLIQVVGYLVLLWGALGVAGIKGITLGRGEQLILAATILWGIENVIAKIALRNIAAEIVAWARMVVGAIILIGIVAATGKMNLMFELNQAQLMATIVGAAFLTGYVLSWYKALKFAPATTVSAVLTVSTIITGLLASGFLALKLTNNELVSFLSILAGVILITRIFSLRGIANKSY